jgi:hypothetical protein
MSNANTEPGQSMVHVLKGHRAKDAESYLKPLYFDLRALTGLHGKGLALRVITGPSRGKRATRTRGQSAVVRVSRHPTPSSR